MGDGLVEEDDAGILRHKAGQADQLSLATRNLRVGSMGKMLNAHLGHRRARPFPIVPAWHQAREGGPARQHHFPDWQGERRLVELWQVADPPRPFNGSPNIWMDPE